MQKHATPTKNFLAVRQIALHGGGREFTYMDSEVAFSNFF